MESFLQQVKKVQLVKEIEQVAKNYLHAKKQLVEIKQLSEDDSDNPYALFIQKVEKAFYGLDPLEQRFINNEFFLEAYPGWWEDQYTKSSFYYLKRKSMKRFKELLDAA